jgi:ABC-2 type transport system ATP-binding protein
MGRPGAGHPIPWLGALLGGPAGPKNRLMTNSRSGPVVEVHDLSRRYGGPRGFTAVRGVSFQVERGELFALLGTNGAGKTSIMELVEGLARPNGGRVRVLGHDPFTERAAVRPRVGVMLQEGGFPADLTVAETAGMWAGTLSAPRPVGEVLALTGLAQRATVRVQQLSGGERRRLDLALALLGRPQVLFLDEPTTGLDPQSRGTTWELVRELLRDGTTVLLTTHYLHEAQELADRIAIMRAGRIVAAGSPAELTADYPARISFVLPDGIGSDQLPALSHARPGVPSGTAAVTVETDSLQESLAELLGWAAERHVTLGHLNARSASLEEAFLAIAGDVESGEIAEVRS